MDDKRNGLIALAEYLESLGIEINIGKNKARGNKGVFLSKGGKHYRIDIAKSAGDETLSVLLHEFAHYIHYCHDKKLESLNFVFEDLTAAETEELMKLTVLKIPKEYALAFYSTKNELNNEIKILTSSIKNFLPDFRKTIPLKTIERTLSGPVKYLLKYDRIIFNNKIYSVNSLMTDIPDLTKLQYDYILLKSKQRQLSRLNAKINKLNKYYNNHSELWARFFELFFTNEELTRKTAPMICKKFDIILKNDKIKEITNIKKILQFIN